jgi:hypothetical protein
MEQGENESVNCMFFQEGPAPANFTVAYQPYLFNTQQHRLLQSTSGWKEFHLLNHDSKTVEISVYFMIENGLAKNPFRAPFGGFEMTENIQPGRLLNFIAEIEKVFRRDNIQAIEILCPPELYSKSQPIITSTLVSQGYEIITTEPGACVVVDETSLVKKMAKDKLTRLKKCEKAGIVFRDMSFNRLREVYAFIESCRSQQERQLSMTLAELERTVNTLPESFFIVGVFDNERLVGTSICVRVNSSIVYTFYSAHDPGYNEFSPMVFLLSKLYDWCSSNKIKLLDLGTSALGGKPNTPLLDFKIRMGATPTDKFKFRKALR